MPVHIKKIHKNTLECYMFYKAIEIYRNNASVHEKKNDVVVKKPQQNILKSLIPILIAAVVSYVIVFAVFGITTTPPSEREQQHSFVKAWASVGTENRQFELELVTDIAIDSLDNVYVADYGNHKIQKFDSNGKFITSWGSNVSTP